VTSPSGPGTLDDVAEQLYGLHPDAFVPARDDAVAEARQAGDRDLARAIARLRRPTRAAWLANLLARERPEQLDGLLALAGDLASAQRTLDGSALRALSAQRNRLVTAMAREGGRLAAQAGDSATESVVRDLAGILDAALADPAIAEEVRSGRLTRTVSYSGFGPGPGGAGQPAPARDRPGTGRGGAGGSRADDGGSGGTGGRSGDGSDADGGADREHAEQERAEREKAERRRAERAERERAVAEAERAADDARDRQESADADRADAESAHEAAKAQVADLTAELEAARERERSAAGTARAATAAARDAAREAATAAARADRARGRLAELDPD
jgi:hypothetical protein